MAGIVGADAPYWIIAAGGKRDITIVQLLSHQGGFPSADVTQAAWEDHELLRRTVSAFTLEWTPGSRVYYHGRAAHWVAAVLIEALTKGQPAEAL